MNKTRKRAFKPYREQLKSTFDDAASNASTPGKARTWFEPYLAELLRTYTDLKETIVDGKPLSRALGRNPRAAFAKLIRTTGKRDTKTTSRWAAALAYALQCGIAPEHLARWLRKGGGVAGRASEIAKARNQKHEPLMSPEAKASSPE